MKRTFLYVGLCLVVAVPSFPAENNKPSARPKVEKLVEQLADKDFETRQKAAKDLESLGAEALPALRKFSNHDDKDARNIIRSLIKKFEETSRLAPKRVTLDMNDKPLKEIIEELAKQSGYKLDIGGLVDEKKKYRLQCKNATFWEALDDLCALEGVVPQLDWNDGNSIHLYLQNRDQPHVFRHGAFRMVPQSFHVSRSNRLDARPRDPKAQAADLRGHESLQLTFNIMAEPRLRLMGVGDPQVAEAEDSEGQSLMPDRQVTTERMSRFRLSGQESVSLQLAAPLAKAASVKKLKGTLPVYLLKESKTVTVTDKLDECRGKKFKIETQSIEVEDFQKRDDGSFQLRISFQVARGEEFNVEMLSLVDEKDVKLRRGGWGMRGNNRNYTADITYLVGGTAPVKLTYTILTPEKHVIPFEFKDLPLP